MVEPTSQGVVRERSMTKIDDFDGFHGCGLRHETHLGKTIDCKNSIQDSLEIRKRYKTLFRETVRSTPDQCKWTSPARFNYAVYQSNLTMTKL